MYVMQARFTGPKRLTAAEVPAAYGRVTQGSAGSVRDGCTGKGGDEMWRIALLQSQRSSRHYIGSYMLGKAVWLQQQGS